MRFHRGLGLVFGITARILSFTSVPQLYCGTDVRAKLSFAALGIPKGERGQHSRVISTGQTATGIVTSALFFGSVRLARWLSAISSATSRERAR